MSFEVGDKAPDFSLPADGGTEVALKDYKGKPVVLYFIPRTTPRAASPKRAPFATRCPTSAR